MLRRGTNHLFFWLGIPVLAPGVNGASAHAVKAVAGALAVNEGYGKGEYSGWLMNMRAISTAIATVSYGSYYAWCMDTRRWAGSVDIPAAHIDGRGR